MVIKFNAEKQLSIFAIEPSLYLIEDKIFGENDTLKIERIKHNGTIVLSGSRRIFGCPKNVYKIQK